MAAHYSFPVLEIKDILTSLSDLEIQVNEADLKKPTQEAIRPVYEGFIQIILGLTREELQQLPFSTLNCLEYPELHEEGIAILAFNRSLNKIMRAAGIEDFTPRDLQKPEQKRTMKILSALINLAKHREEKFAMFAERHERTAILVERKRQLEEAHMKALKRLEAFKAERAAQQPMVDRLNQEVENMKNTIADLNKQQSQVRHEFAQLQPRRAELINQLDNLTLRILKEAQDCQQLRGEIVEPPEKLQAVLTEVEANTEQEKMLIKDLEKRDKEWKAKCESYSKAEKDVRKCIKLMEEVEVELRRYKSASRAVKAAKAAISANEEEASQVLGSAQFLQAQAEAMAEKCQLLNVQASSKKESIMKAKDAMLMKVAEAEKHREFVDDKIEEILKEVKVLKETEAEMWEEGQMLEKELIKKCTHLFQQLKAYNSSLLEAMEEPPTIAPPPRLEDYAKP